MNRLVKTVSVLILVLAIVFPHAIPYPFHLTMIGVALSAYIVATIDAIRHPWRR